MIISLANPVATNTYHPFDPSLRPVFSGDADRASLTYRRDSRELFYTLMHISEHDAVYPAAYDFIKRHLLEIHQGNQNPNVKAYRPDKISAEIAALPPLSGTIQSSDDSLQNCLLQLSPIILTEPCWLQFISQAATSEHPLAVDLMAIYLEFTREDKNRNLFQALLLTSGLDLPDLTSRAFAQQENIGECMFDFAAIQLALFCFPRVFFPEILGFTQAYCQSQSILEHFRQIDSAFNPSHFLDKRRHALASAIPALNKIIDTYLCSFSGQADALWQRIQSGFGLYSQLADRCCRHLHQQLEHPPSTCHELVKLLQRKAPAAFGHHSRIKLTGKSLDDWFAQTPFDSASFLSALKRSSYIDSDHPGNSLLLKLFDFGGPMFGVLSNAEKCILENWLISEKADIQNAPSAFPQPVNKSVADDAQNSSAMDYSKLTNRELYYYLVNADIYPDVLATARSKVHKVLRSAKRFQRLPFKQYQHQVFEDYLDRLYQREVNAYQPIKAAPKLSKKAYVWGIEQFAPTILTDGCWLQNAGQLKYYPNHAIGALLFKIFEDEAGNGKLEQNHPFIYRQLLDSVNISLPPIGSKEFIGYPGFIDSAFDIPVYLLSISKFPSAFLPELLGLNMAIELSGLGKGYLQLSDELKFWGINPAIVDIHISIDNMASGHAFLAKNAIQHYLDDCAANLGNEAVQAHWRRIFTGYCSLQTVCRRFKLALVFRYLLKGLTGGDHPSGSCHLG